MSFALSSLLRRISPAACAHVASLITADREFWFGGASDPLTLTQVWDSLVDTDLPDMDQLPTDQHFKSLDDVFHVLCMNLASPFYPPRRMFVLRERTGAIERPADSQSFGVVLNVSNQLWNVILKLTDRDAQYIMVHPGEAVFIPSLDAMWSAMPTKACEGPLLLFTYPKTESLRRYTHALHRLDWFPFTMANVLDPGASSDGHLHQAMIVEKLDGPAVAEALKTNARPIRLSQPISGLEPVQWMQWTDDLSLPPIILGISAAAPKVLIVSTGRFKTDSKALETFVSTQLLAGEPSAKVVSQVPWATPRARDVTDNDLDDLFD